MNTVITKIIDGDTEEILGFDFNENLGDRVVESLIKNNTFVPNIERVIFNTKTTDEVAKKDGDGNPVLDDNGRVVKETVALENPVLVTVVYFKDGTKVTVKNSDKDAITLVDEKVKLSDGTETTVRTASQESKEIGLVYAIVKRIVCGYDNGGNVQNAGFAKFLHKVVSNALVQDIAEAKMAGDRKISKAKAKEAKAERKDKPPKAKRDLRSVVTDLAATVGGLKDIVSKLIGKNADE
jgi:hypothetical protein